MGYSQRARCDFPHQALASLCSRMNSFVEQQALEHRIKAPEEPYDGRVADLTVAEFPEKFGWQLSMWRQYVVAKVVLFVAGVAGWHAEGVVSVRGAVRALQTKLKACCKQKVRVLS